VPRNDANFGIGTLGGGRRYPAGRTPVTRSQARLYVGGAAQPALIVNDLKRGAEAHGTVGLFVGIGADGHFRNLSVRPR
jgi:hypothetical protein